MLQKVRYIVQTQGVSGLAHRSIAFAYHRGVRPCLPRLEPVRYAGIPTCYDRRRGDSMVPASWTDPLDQPDYEATLIAGLNETVRPGDSVVIVGGGVGVTAVIAALRTGPSGTVLCFEGSRKYVWLAQQTAARNGVTNLRVHHAVVAKAIGVYTTGSDVGRCSLLLNCPRATCSNWTARVPRWRFSES